MRFRPLVCAAAGPGLFRLGVASARAPTNLGRPSCSQLFRCDLGCCRMGRRSVAEAAFDPALGHGCMRTVELDALSVPGTLTDSNLDSDTSYGNPSHNKVSTYWNSRGYEDRLGSDGHESRRRTCRATTESARGRVNISS